MWSAHAEELDGVIFSLKERFSKMREEKKKKTKAPPKGAGLRWRQTPCEGPPFIAA